MAPKAKPLVEGEDFYREGEYVVLTSNFLLKRGYCCNSGCRHCPYKKAIADSSFSLEIHGIDGDESA